jgi:hypothetical protein
MRALAYSATQFLTLFQISDQALSGYQVIGVSPVGNTNIHSLTGFWVNDFSAGVSLLGCGRVWTSK